MNRPRSVESTMFCAYLLSITVAACVGMQLQHVGDCGSHAVVHSMKLEPCDSEPCTIHKGHTYNGIFNFTSTIDSVNATNKASTDMFEIDNTFAVTPLVACGNGMTCPVRKGSTQVYTASVKCPLVDDMRLIAKWEVKGDNDKDILCVTFPVFIVD